MKPERPWGVTVLAILTAIASVLLAAGGILIVSGTAVVGVPFASMTGISLAFIVFALLILYFAWAIWHLKPWAWIVLVISSGIGVVASLIALVSGWSAADAVGIATNGIVLYYLFRPQVRVAFRRT